MCHCSFQWWMVEYEQRDMEIVKLPGETRRSIGISRYNLGNFLPCVPRTTYRGDDAPKLLSEALRHCNQFRCSPHFSAEIVIDRVAPE